MPQSNRKSPFKVFKEGYNVPTKALMWAEPLVNGGSLGLGYCSLLVFYFFFWVFFMSYVKNIRVSLTLRIFDPPSAKKADPPHQEICYLFSHPACSDLTPTRVNPPDPQYSRL